MQIKQRRPKAVKMDWRRQVAKSFIAMMERILQVNNPRLKAEA